MNQVDHSRPAAASTQSCTSSEERQYAFSSSFTTREMPHRSLKVSSLELELCFKSVGAFLLSNKKEQPEVG